MIRLAHTAALGVALLACGCSLTAVRPPTPAAGLPPGAFADAPPGERYYLMVFGSQTVPKVPRFTHTFATVVRASSRPGLPGPALECHTISWLPADLSIHPFRFAVEPGANFDLDTTLRYVTGEGERVSVWGPYEVYPGFYRRWLIQKGFLESGAVGYQCIDTVGEAARLGNGNDCVHAITDQDPLYGRGRYPLLFYGESASHNLVRRIARSPVIVDPPATHDWLIPALGLDRYPLVRRQYLGRIAPYVPGGPTSLKAPVD